MTLSDPASRKLLHNRKVECFGYQRDDAWASDSLVIAKRFPEFYTGPKKTPV